MGHAPLQHLVQTRPVTDGTAQNQGLVAEENTPPKPRLRGVSHQVSFFLTLIAGAWLISMADSATRWACAIYIASLAGQFGVSALYHRPNWKPETRQWWRRLDHAFIMVLIAGTGTPLAMKLPPATMTTVLWVLWSAAGLGVLRALVWITAPKPVAALLALTAAWLMSPFLPDFNRALGAGAVTWLLAGGVFYSLGAAAYALKRPNPWPRTFGYHEIFHALVIVAAVCHFIAIAVVTVQ